jgi:hypothetical protein
MPATAMAKAVTWDCDWATVPLSLSNEDWYAARDALTLESKAMNEPFAEITQHPQAVVIVWLKGGWENAKDPEHETFNRP